MSVIYNGKEFKVKKGNLDLSNNEIVNIGEIHGFNELRELKFLNLSNNRIVDLTGLEQLLNLKVLNLAYNDIRNIHELEKLNTLEYLNLSNNAITTLTGISKLTKLKTLNISNNQISNIEELNSLKNLTKIYLQGNNVEQSSQIRLQESLGIEIERPIVKVRERPPSGFSQKTVKIAWRTALIIMLILPFMYPFIFVNAIAASLSLNYGQALLLTFLPVLIYTLLIYFGIIGLSFFAYGVASDFEEVLIGGFCTSIVFEILFAIFGFFIYSIFAPYFFRHLL